jgi:hypothetical protein
VARSTAARSSSGVFSSRTVFTRGTAMVLRGSAWRERWSIARASFCALDSVLPIVIRFTKRKIGRRSGATRWQPPDTETAPSRCDDFGEREEGRVNLLSLRVMGLKLGDRAIAAL